MRRRYASLPKHWPWLSNLVMKLLSLLQGATRDITLVRQDGEGREAGFDMLLEVREAASRARFKSMVLEADIHIAKEKTRVGDLDGGIELAGPSSITCLARADSFGSQRRRLL